MAISSGSHAGFDFQPGGGIRLGEVWWFAGFAGADDELSAAHISLDVAASAAENDGSIGGWTRGSEAFLVRGTARGSEAFLAVGFAGDVGLAVVDDFGSMPRCCSSGLRFFDGAGDSVDTAVADAGVAVDDDAVDGAGRGCLRQDGYP